MKTALLVIDMQNDYLWEKRKKRFSYNATALGAVKRGLNAAILREGTVTRFPENKVNAIRERLNSAGIQYIDTVRK